MASNILGRGICLAQFAGRRGGGFRQDHDG